MDRYVENSLTEGETLLYEGRLSLWAMGKPIALGSLIGLISLPALFYVRPIGVILLLVAASILGKIYVRYQATEIAVTSERIIAKSGFVTLKTMELFLNKIESLQVKQTLVGKTFDYGTLIISGAGNPIEMSPIISKPNAFRHAFQQARAAHVAAPHEKSEGL